MILMFQALIRLFIRDSEQTHLPEVRGRYGVLAGAVGITLNLCLFAAKFVAGLLTASIAITADAFNNLSDAGSSVVTLIGFKMAGMPADNEHPFGHGRIEYLSGLAVSLAILLVGTELIKSSFAKILAPASVTFSAISLGILAASVAVKLWMCFFNRVLAKKIDSTAMRATSMDSLTDAVATSAVIVSIVISRIFSWQLDGWIGLLVALFILYTGFTTARDSLSPLLGKAPDVTFVQGISDLVLSYDEVVGIHDLIIHDYGPGRCMISLHAEVPCNMNVLVMHDAIDRIEFDLRQHFNCEVTIHMDPIAVDDEVTNEMRTRIATMVREVDPAITIHDFRMVQGSSHTNLIFDVLVPHKFHLTDALVAERVRDGVRSINPDFFAVIKVEKAFI